MKSECCWGSRDRRDRKADLAVWVRSASVVRVTAQFRCQPRHAAAGCSYLVPCTVSGLVGGWSLIRAVTISRLAPPTAPTRKAHGRVLTWRLLLGGCKMMNQSALHVLICTHYLWRCISLMQCARSGKLQVFRCFSFRALQIRSHLSCKTTVPFDRAQMACLSFIFLPLTSSPCQIFIRAFSHRRLPRFRRVFASNLSALVVLNPITGSRLQSTPILPTRFAWNHRR